MRVGRTWVAALAVAMMLGAAVPAGAGGSIALSDVLVAVKTAPKLVAEIRAALKQAGRTADDVVCAAARHGNHWTHLGGARAAPYECRIGDRDLTIEAERRYFDSSGRRLGDLDHADPARAARFRETGFRWEWTKASD